MSKKKGSRLTLPAGAPCSICGKVVPPTDPDYEAVGDGAQCQDCYDSDPTNWPGTAFSEVADDSNLVDKGHYHAWLEEQGTSPNLERALDPAIPIDWKLIAVFDATPPFVYSAGIWEHHLLPELWVSGLGECGHRVDLRGVAAILNIMGQVLTTDATGFAHPFIYDFGSGVLTFTADGPSADEATREELQIFQAADTAPVIRVRWRCCP